MVEAAHTRSTNFCTACFDGAYPIAMDEQMKRSKLMLEPAGLAATARQALQTPEPGPASLGISR